MTTTHRRTPAERRAFRCAICLPATDDTIAGGTDHRVEDHARSLIDTIANSGEMKLGEDRVPRATR